MPSTKISPAIHNLQGSVQHTLHQESKALLKYQSNMAPTDEYSWKPYNLTMKLLEPKITELQQLYKANRDDLENSQPYKDCATTVRERWETITRLVRQRWFDNNTCPGCEGTKHILSSELKAKIKGFEKTMKATDLNTLTQAQLDQFAKQFEGFEDEFLLADTSRDPQSECKGIRGLFVFIWGIREKAKKKEPWDSLLRNDRHEGPSPARESDQGQPQASGSSSSA